VDANIHLQWQILTFSWLDSGKIYTNLCPYCVSPKCIAVLKCQQQGAYFPTRLTMSPILWKMYLNIKLQLNFERNTFKVISQL
jgi:hypothetical protein